MIRQAIRQFLNKRGYDIIKRPYPGDPYPGEQEGDGVLYKTPIGKYYLPADSEKDGEAFYMKRGKVQTPQIIETAKRFIKPGTAVLDVGANFGQIALLLADLTGPSGKVYAFEAQDKVFRFLKKNIEANGKTGTVIPVEGAVYYADGITLIFPEPDLNTYNAYSANSINPQLKVGREVKTITIDSMAIQERISFAKIDIQGSDIFALRGAKQTILKNRMPILFEFEPEFQEQFNTTFQDYVDFVAEVDYVFTDVTAGNNYLVAPRA